MFVEGLRDFADFGLHEELDVEREFGAGGGEQCEEPAELGEAVAFGMPCDFGDAEVERGGEGLLTTHGVFSREGG